MVLGNPFMSVTNSMRTAQRWEVLTTRYYDPSPVCDQYSLITRRRAAPSRLLTWVTLAARVGTGGEGRAAPRDPSRDAMPAAPDGRVPTNAAERITCIMPE